jgi:hypothetical protein
MATFFTIEIAEYPKTADGLPLSYVLEVMSEYFFQTIAEKVLQLNPFSSTHLRLHRCPVIYTGMAQWLKGFQGQEEETQKDIGRKNRLKGMSPDSSYKRGGSDV